MTRNELNKLNLGKKVTFTKTGDETTLNEIFQAKLRTYSIYDSPTILFIMDEVIKSFNNGEYKLE